MLISVVPSLATIDDVDPIAALVGGDAFKDDGSGALLPLSKDEIGRLVSEGRFAVVRFDEGVVGCVSLVEYAGIAELRSLMVTKAQRSHGIGAHLVMWCIEEAARRGHRKLFALVNRDAIKGFTKWGFVETDRPPEKLTRDCQVCPLFHLDKCKEVALMRPLTAG